MKIGTILKKFRYLPTHYPEIMKKAEIGLLQILYL